MSTHDTRAAVKTAPNLGEKMNQYRKKPVVITAVQFTKELRDAHIFDGARLPDGVTRGASNYHTARREVYSATFYVKTLEGEMHVELDDWVITGVKGEHYPCKPDIFAATYEPANAAQESAPAELPPLSIKTWQERLREKFPETADRNLFAVGHLEHAMESEIADLRATQPSQDQVAAVRAVPEGMPVAQEPKYGIRENRLFNRASGEFIPLDEPVFIFRARDKLAAQALADYRFHCADEQHRVAIALRFIDFERFANDHPDRMKYPDTAVAPSPQPELSGSIDTPEFRQMLELYRQNKSMITTKNIVAYVTAKIRYAVASETNRCQEIADARQRGWDSQWDAQIESLELRTEKAESRLAEIQRGVHGLDRYGFDGKFGGDFGGDPFGPFVKIDEVRALLQPPSQNDTSGLPG